MTDLPPIYFYLPESYSLDTLPASADIYAPGLYRDGVYCWTVQTYLHLQADGFPCKITNKIPEQGIVMVHRSCIPENWQPKPNLLLVCLMADKERHPLAQFHIVLNTKEPLLQEPQNLWPSCFIPHWPQPGLIKRDDIRSDRFEQIAFFGHPRNLDPALQAPTWEERLNQLGLTWQIVDRDRWHDFSQIDAIVAVRSFTKTDFFDKPATKLYNSWHAGVPAIFGRETSVQNERKSELDYMEVTSVDEALAALKRLRDDLDWRKAMIENGYLRAQETEYHHLTKRWQNVLTEQIVPEYERWCAMNPQTQQLLSIHRYLSLKTIRINSRVRSLFSPA